MAYAIEKVDVWSATLLDKPGGLADKLAPLAKAGVSLEFVLARRDRPGRGIVFLAPIKGAAPIRIAKAAGITRTKDIQALRIEGTDKSGLGAKMTVALADADINVRGLSAIAIGRRALFYLALDNSADASKAKRILTKVLDAK